LTIYPNPAENVLRISLDNPQQLIIQVQVLNYIGAVLIDRTIEQSSNEIFDLDISHLDQGVYILKTIINGTSISSPWMKK
jgi:hypothetical protein